MPEPVNNSNKVDVDLWSLAVAIVFAVYIVVDYLKHRDLVDLKIRGLQMYSLDYDDPVDLYRGKF